MQQIVGDLWQCQADWLCITTNGVIRRNGEAVMGRGCAAQAVDKIPGIQVTLGKLLHLEGNHVHFLGFYGIKRVYSFPVKQDWKDNADTTLIAQSARELQTLWADWVKVSGEVPQVVIPRPGCGAGKLTWQQVKPSLEALTDDAFKIIAFKQNHFV